MRKCRRSMVLLQRWNATVVDDWCIILPIGSITATPTPLRKERAHAVSSGREPGAADHNRRMLMRTARLLSCACLLLAPAGSTGGRGSGARAPEPAQPSAAAPLNIIAFGAHPDDCDQKAGGVAVKWVAAGHHVRFVSVTNGDAGHQSQGGGALAA